MADCRTCKHNTYINAGITDWVSCCHPTTLAKGARWEAGDPAFLNYQTGDVPASRIAEMGDCAAYESQSN